MALCRRCGKPISDRYIFCYECNQYSKTYKDQKGYIRFKDSGKPLHRYVAEKKLGRRLRPGEIVHHKDRNKSDNKWDNLWVFKSQQEHDEIHNQDKQRHGTTAAYQGFKKKKSWWNFW